MVESDVGSGTAIHVCFPVITTITSGVEPVPLAVIPGDGAHIMYVDDEEALVFVMTRTLERLGYACTGFTDAGAAIHAFRTDPASFDAVVTDYAMPDMTGMELAAALLEIRPDVPVALATGYGLGDDAARATVGLAARLHKPISVETLSHALARMLHRAA
jgi:DNA-binding NtrC family response regulator